MKVLHLTLGLPQIRNGGLSRYSYDLAIAEKKLGVEVALLYPGNIDLINKNSRIVEKKNVGVKAYKLVNPEYVPIPLGIGNPELFLKHHDIEPFKKFIEKIQPDYVHIHSFMGFPIEYFRYMKACEIKTVYTTHDYYAICLRTSLINNQNKNCEGPSAEGCAYCNYGFNNSSFMQFVLQSEWYPKIKNSKLIGCIKNKRAKEKNDSEGLKQVCSYEMTSRDYSNYAALLEQKKGLLEGIDLIHFNSTVAQQIYKKYISNNSEFVVQNITTEGLVDNRNKIRKYKNTNKVQWNIGFIGTSGFHKGAWMLIGAAKILNEKGFDFLVHFYGDEYGIVDKYSFCREHGTYNHANIANIMNELDFLVVPGFCYETFGFTAIEGLANNVLVLVSNRVGARDLFEGTKAMHVFSPTSEELAKMLENYFLSENIYFDALDEQRLIAFDFDMQNHAIKMLELIENKLKVKRTN
ncbi:glycosyltransferase [Blautia coccoides]|uniref:glycosyltransferase n=1 Tax=Blautia producta TaxID=33035 RepID=UPI001D00ADDE|nr:MULTISPECIES: glycosyltransferase [Blautia]MCB5874736.1 glycosyltransferase [Blautia producta]MCQ4639346.1 glycosyltransferase [Blautia coccoides]